MARINDSAGSYHATRITQSDQITAQDKSDGGYAFLDGIGTTYDLLTQETLSQNLPRYSF